MMLLNWSRKVALCDCGRVLSGGVRFLQALSSPHSLLPQTVYGRRYLSSAMTYTSEIDMLPPPKPYQLQRRKINNKKSDRESSSIFLSKLLALLAGGAVAIVAVLVVDWNMMNEETREERRKDMLKRFEEDETWSVTKHFISMPCQRNSILLAVLGAFSSWIVTFLLTSSRNRAWLGFSMGGAFIYLSFMSYCTYEREKSVAEEIKLKHLLGNRQKAETLLVKEGDEADKK